MLVGGLLGALLGALAGPPEKELGERVLLGALCGAVIATGRASTAQQVIDVAAAGVR